MKRERAEGTRGLVQVRLRIRVRVPPLLRPTPPWSPKRAASAISTWAGRRRAQTRRRCCGCSRGGLSVFVRAHLPGQRLGGRAPLPRLVLLLLLLPLVVLLVVLLLVVVVMMALRRAGRWLHCSRAPAASPAAAALTSTSATHWSPPLPLPSPP